MIPVSKLVLGTANFGSSVSGRDAEAIIDYALAHGITAIDTADSYGDAEEIVGEALQGRRDSVFVSTKVGNPSPNGSGLSEKHIAEAIQHSLHRLRTDHIDLYYAHNWDKNTPLTETLTAFNDVVTKGYAAALGCSNFTAGHIRESLALAEALGVVPFTTLQPVYNFIERGAEQEILPLALEKRLSVWAYSPLAGGVLTGKYSYGIPRESRAVEFLNANPREAGFIPKITEENRAVGARVATIAEEFGVTPSQLAIAWVLSNPAVTSVIVGVRSIPQLQGILDSTVPQEALEGLSL